jgi:hypothetical protein
VDYLFTVLGSDHPSIIEAYVRRQKILGHEFPRMVLFQHEVRMLIACLPIFFFFFFCNHFLSIDWAWGSNRKTKFFFLGPF